MATINIFGEIGWEVEASTVIELIQDTKDDEINVIISSGGGSAFEGLMIYDALKAFSAQEGKSVNTKILGLGASAASVIFMAGDSREMGEGSLLMVHNSWSQFVGNRQEVIEQLGTLEAIDNRMLNIFQKGTGLRAEDLEELLNQETWMTVDVAMQYGFANTVGESVAIAASIYDSYKTKKEPVNMAVEETKEEAGFLSHMMAYFKKDEPKAEAKAEDEEEVVEEEEKELKADSKEEEVEAKAEDEKPEEEEAKAMEDGEEKPEEEAKAEEHEDDKEEMKARIESLENQLAEAKASAEQAADISKEEAEKASMIFNAVAEHKFTMFEAKELAQKSMEDVKAACESTLPNASGAGKTERPEKASIENKYDAWMALKSEGKHAEAQAYYNENRNEILKDK